MSDFSKDQPTPQHTSATAFGPHESGVPVQCCDNCEAPKLGAESIANFGAPHGVAPSHNKIH